jgi:hypothetical protein
MDAVVVLVKDEIGYGGRGIFLIKTMANLVLTKR